MAATDKNYRNQKALDIVFGVSCVLMLISIVLMFAQDYYRGWKRVQRQFRDVDEAVTQRPLLADVTDEMLTQAEAAEGEAAESRKNVDQVKSENASAIQKALATRDKRQELAASLKADFDSKQSLYVIAVDLRDESPARSAALQAVVNSRLQEVEELGAKLAQATRELNDAEGELLVARKPVADAEAVLAKKEDALKRVTGKVDTIAKAVAKKRWGFGDWVRALPVIDGFASPYKIKQVTLEDYTIDYSFKRVTRYDRCQTCHLGMEQDKFSPEALKDIAKAEPSDADRKKLQRIRDFYERRKKSGESIGFDPSDLPTDALSVKLTEAQQSQFAAHPRLDLFVEANSPHPVEKFGCTSCHSGQGSSTDFENASHTPSTMEQKEQWVKHHSWEATHGGDWEYPMLAKRFVESSCLKCHHQVTDLVRYGSKEEAPKLLKGYNLVREFGCFGCHEIAGTKRGVEVGPDLRLEPALPLEAMSPAEREKALADLQNPPGAMRKVGPSLYRLTEKTNEDWVRKWVNDPRGFRPSTRMPHFFNLSNNSPGVLPDEQKAFPDAEVRSIAHYLMVESRAYLEGNDLYRRILVNRREQLKKQAAQESLSAADARELRLLENWSRQEQLENQMQRQPLSEKDRKELQDLRGLTERIELPVLQLQSKPAPLTDKTLVDGEGKTVSLPALPTGEALTQEIAQGAQLFRERGCLACHQHEGTAQEVKYTRNNLQQTVRSVTSEATFGPDLTRIAAKLGSDKGDANAKRRWLTQWILNPTVHFPRTRMPITHLTVEQAAAVADWLLGQQNNPPADWKEIPDTDMKTLRALTFMYLVKAPNVSPREAEAAMNATGDEPPPGLSADKDFKPDADERRLQKKVTADDLQWYIGKKALSRYGCYGCHDVPGFELGKPIGTPLNDWGKKDPERLAFEDIVPYVDEHYHQVDRITNEKGFGPESKEGKPPFERYFFDALEHHVREGFLYQKLNEPRSYDYHRLRAWDDRLKMPQFKFAHHPARPLEGESQEQADARVELEARDAVMTFVLGLVAEPTPSKYLPAPSPDRHAEIKGRQVLDKFNCAGCHEVRPGIYEFKVPTKRTDRPGDLLTTLDQDYDKAAPSLLTDHIFPNHNAWTGAPPVNNRLLVYGVDRKQLDKEANEPPAFSIRLTHALRYPSRDENGKEAGWRDIPAASIPELPDRALTSHSDTYGGVFARLLTPYLIATSSVDYPNEKEARSALPPTLIREGEKVQPAWLHGFLRNPTQIRPRVVLRMPKFNFSDAEVQSLVDYFAAVDRLENPGSSVMNPYLAREQPGPSYWTERSAVYAAKAGPNRIKLRGEQLKPALADYVRYRGLPDAEQKLAVAKAAQTRAQKAVEDEKDPARKADLGKAADKAKQEVDQLAEAVKKLQTGLEKNDFPDLEKSWRENDLFGTEAYRLMLQTGQNGTCVRCHQIGNVTADENKAPNLDKGYERLRPEWTLRWIGNPERLITYPSPMNAYFMRENPADPQDVQRRANEKYREEMVGSSAEQIQALRDALLGMPAILEMPGNRYYRPVR